MAAETKITTKRVLEKIEEYLRQHKKIDEEDDLNTILARQLPKITFNKTSEDIIKKVDEILGEKINEETSIELLHTLTLCGAQTVIYFCEEAGVEIFPQSEIPDKFPETQEEQQKLYRNSVRLFKRLLFKEEKSIPPGKVPTVEDIEEHWSSLWEKSNTGTEYLEYVKKEEERMNKKIQTFAITMKDLNKAFRTRKNWSPAGIDGVQVFWYKKFSSVRAALLVKFNRIVSGEEEMPGFFTVGFTKLSPKDENNTEDPKKYRPITHLPTIYKMIMRCVYQKVFAHYEEHGVLAEEQCGGRKNYFGTRKALVFDSVALNQEQVYGRYVDFKKAFDSVSHEWILQMLRVYQVNETLVTFLQNTMKKWKTRIQLRENLTRSIAFKRGVFQGDPISVLLFWTALNPLSFRLKEKGLSLTSGHISHVLYMDDLKLYAGNAADSNEMYKEVEIFAAKIGMELNEGKTHEFFVPRKHDNKPETYLGYVQDPKIDSETITRRKTKKFEEKCQEIENTKIRSENKQEFKKKFLYNSIFNTFGVLHWPNFKGTLQTIQVKRRFNYVGQERGKELNDISLKFINEMSRMRKDFYENNSNFVKNIIKSDQGTPLKLSQSDEEKYIEVLVGQMTGTNNKKRKRSNVLDGNCSGAMKV